MIIAIIGADGAGKTTTANELYQELKQEGHHVDLNKSFEDYFLLKFPLHLLGNARRQMSKKFIFERNKFPIFLLWPYLVYIDQLFLYFYVRIFKRKIVTICDRYVYSFLVSWT